MFRLLLRISQHCPPAFAATISLPKYLVVDELVAYNGGCNATNASLVNGQQVWKVTDAGVAADAYKAAWEEARGVKSL